MDLVLLEAFSDQDALLDRLNLLMSAICQSPTNCSAAVARLSAHIRAVPPPPPQATEPPQAAIPPDALGPSSGQSPVPMDIAEAATVGTAPLVAASGSAPESSGAVILAAAEWAAAAGGVADVGGVGSGGEGVAGGGGKAALAKELLHRLYLMIPKDVSENVARVEGRAGRLATNRLHAGALAMGKTQASDYAGKSARFAFCFFLATPCLKGPAPASVFTTKFKEGVVTIWESSNRATQREK